MKKVSELANRVYLERLGELVERIEGNGQGAEEIQSAVQKYRSWHDAVNLAAQSPIEQILGAALIFNTCGYGQLVRGETEEIWGWGGALFVQREVLGYRADFLIECHHESRSSRLVIECDGHDFHERTKEQAASDRKRDREMIAKGLSVIRFTGSEIFRDPLKCAVEVEIVTARLMDDLLARAGIISE